MLPSIVFVTESPASTRKILPIAQAFWPGYLLYAVPLMQQGRYEFRYPRGLTYSDFPYIKDPRWKIRESDLAQRVFRLYGDDTVVVEADFSAVIKQAENVIFAADPHPSSAYAFDVLLSQVLGQAEAGKERPAVIAADYARPALELAMTAPDTTHSADFASWRHMGQARRFFDYNFNVNSLALFNPILNKAGIHAGFFEMSKFSLQLLYWIRNQEPLTEAQIMSAMHAWTGTGRYQEKAQIGSTMSRWQIVENLRAAGLLAKNGDQRLTIAPPGEQVLAALHPDCEDPDLPFRLHRWQAEWPASRSSVEQYLRTFFGKQKRYSAPTTATRSA